MAPFHVQQAMTNPPLLRHPRRPGLLSLTALGFMAALALVLGGCTGQPPYGWAGPLVGDELLYISSPAGRLAAFSLAVGAAGGTAPLWTFPEGSKKAGGFYGIPLLQETVLYLGTYETGSCRLCGKVYALDSQTGQARWPEPYAVLGGIVGGVASASGHLLVTSSDGRLYALDPASGKEQWRFPQEGKDPLKKGIWAAPTATQETVYLAGLDRTLYALDARTGALRWSFQAEGGLAGAPLVADGVVYFGSFDRHLYAVDRASGRLRWKFQAENWFWTRPLLADGLLYAASLDHHLYALDPANGVLRWSFEADGPLLAWPVEADGLLLLASEKGTVYGVQTTASGGSERWSYKAQAPIHAPLSLADGLLYVTTNDGRTHALEAATGRQRWVSDRLT